jgi:hypothetical protein
MNDSAKGPGATYRVQDADGTQGDIICGTNAGCELDNNNVDPASQSVFGVMTVTLIAAPTTVAGGNLPGLQYGLAPNNGLTIVSVDDAHFKDSSGNALDLANSADRLINLQ